MEYEDWDYKEIINELNCDGLTDKEIINAMLDESIHIERGISKEQAGNIVNYLGEYIHD